MYQTYTTELLDFWRRAKLEPARQNDFLGCVRYRTAFLIDVAVGVALQANEVGAGRLRGVELEADDGVAVEGFC